MGLSRMPFRFRQVEVEPLLSAGVCRMNVRKYSVFYVFDEEGPAVTFSLLNQQTRPCEPNL